MRAAINFHVDDLPSLEEKVRAFLTKEDFPEFDDLLFCIDGQLLDHLDEDHLLRFIFPTRKTVPRELFKPPRLFTEDFERCCRGDWMHLKIYGVLESKAIVSIQSRTDSSYIPDRPVKITLTRFDKKPKWKFAKA